jgi:2-methylcitrate dehydratase PrpD
VADGVDEFVAAVSEALVQDHGLRQRRADALLAQGSWDCTWEAMQVALAARSPLTAAAGRPAQARTGWSNSPGGDD